MSDITTGERGFAPLPPIYSEGDQMRREVLLRAIADIQRRAQEAAEPYLSELAEIEAYYQPRRVLG